MHPILLEQPIESHTLSPIPNARSSYDCILQESIERFLTGIRSGSCDFSALKSVFSRLIQSRLDPPLEIVWFYAAVIYRESIASKRQVLDRILAVRDLLQLIIACSASCQGPKSVAIVAPVVAELYHLMVEVEAIGGEEVGSARRELERLVEGVMGYVSICSKQGVDGVKSCGYLLPSFTDVVRVWTEKGGSEGLEMDRFLPLMNEEIRTLFGEGRCGVEDLATVVAVQAFFLRVLVKLENEGEQTAEVRRELISWVVGMVTGFGSLKCFEVLMKLLLGSNLPAAAHFSSKHKTVLWQILYDSTLLVEYTFLCPPDVEEGSDTLKHLALLRLVVFHEAIQVARRNGDHNKVIDYTNAFSRSCLPSKIVQWTNEQCGASKHTQPNASTPQSLIKWLLSLQNQGVNVLEETILRHCKKLSFDEQDPGMGGNMTIKVDSLRQSEELFFLDTKGEVGDDMAEDHEMEVAGDAFVSAAWAMKSKSNSSKKRRGAKEDEERIRVKAKYKLHDATIPEYFSASANGVSSGSEVENPSDEDMEEMEH